MKTGLDKAGGDGVQGAGGSFHSCNEFGEVCRGDWDELRQWLAGWGGRGR